MSLQQEVTSAYYSSTAARGHSSSRAHYESAADGLRRRLGRWLPPSGARCLDIACGCGELLYMLEREGYATSGIDLCKEELDQAARFVRGKVIHGDAVDFLAAQQPGTYDFISAFNFLEHLPKDRVIEFLRSARDALAPGGALVLMVPNAISPFGASTRYWDVTHEQAFVPNSFRQLAPLAGFTSKVEFRECGPIPHGFTSAIRFGLWQVLRAGIASWFMVELATTRDRIYTMDMLVRLTRADG